MKLLLDGNCHAGWLRRFRICIPTTHVEFVGLDGAADLAICDYAGEHGFVMVTKDVDYDQIIALRNFYPKLIRLTLGNTSNAATLHALRSVAPEIIAELNNPNRGMVELE